MTDIRFFKCQRWQIFLINLEILYNEKRQESNWPLSRLYSCISGVFCNMQDTDLWRNIMHNWPSSCHPVSLCLIFVYTRNVKLSFPNNNIKKFTLWIFTLYVYKISEVTDIPSLIRKYCIRKKARVKLATEPTLFMHFWCLL